MVYNFTNKTCAIYRNGSLVATQYDVAIYYGSYIVLADLSKQNKHGIGTRDNNFTVTIDSLRLYNKALIAEEVATNYTYEKFIGRNI